MTRDVTSASLKSARFERGLSSGDGDFGLESLDCGSAQVPVTGSQICSFIVVAGWKVEYDALRWQGKFRRQIADQITR